MGHTAAAVERAAHLVALYLEPTLRELGITQAEAHVLARLVAAGPTPIASLQREFGHKRSTLTNVLDRLERRRFVRRTINSADRRSVLVHLTATGRPAARSVVRALDGLERDLEAVVRERDLAGLESVVRALATIAYDRRVDPATR